MMSAGSRGIVLVLTTALLGCATSNTSTEIGANACANAGTGLSAPPTPETRALHQALIEADQLSLDALFVEVARGEPAAVAELGLRYANGKDVPQNQDRAVELFAQLAQVGNPLGQYFLAVAYLNGAGVEKDETKAIYFLELSAAQGYDNAQYWLGLTIAQGRGGISANWCAALPLFIASADTISRSAFMVGAAYHEGQVGPADYAEAAKWYRKAIKADMNLNAQFSLRQLIEAYLVEWQDGDPGQPAKKKQN